MAAGCFGISEQPYPRGQLSPRVRHPRWAMAQAGTASSQPGSMGGWQTRPAGHRHHMGTGEHQGDPTRDMRQGASHQGKTIPTGPGRAVSAAGTRHTRGAGQRVTLGLGHTVPVDVCAGGTRRGAGGACGVGRVRDETAARGWDMPCPWVGHAVPVGWDMLCPWGGTHRSCGAVVVGGTCHARGWNMPCPWGRARRWDMLWPWGRGREWDTPWPRVGHAVPVGPCPWVGHAVPVGPWVRRARSWDMPSQPRRGPGVPPQPTGPGAAVPPRADPGPAHTAAGGQ